MSPARNLPPGQRPQKAIDEALGGILEQRRGGLALGWLAVVEHLLPDGGRALTILTADDVRAWQALGWLDAAGEVLRAELRDDERERHAQG